MVIDTVNEVLVSNEKGVLVTKNSFPYKIDNILSSLPHLEQSLGALTDTNTINESVFFKHSKIVKAFVDSVLKSNLLELKSDSKTNHLMREELVQYLINGVQWDSKFEGYNNIKHTINISNNFIFIAIFMVFKYLRNLILEYC